MKKFKNYDFDREKKMHRVEKSNRVVKHRKAIYNYEVDDEDVSVGMEVIEGRKVYFVCYDF